MTGKKARGDLYRELNLSERLPSRITKGEKALETLQQRRKLLPKVDRDGRSDCAFAENLYVQAEEAEQKLRYSETELVECSAAVTGEIEEARRDAGIIVRGIRSLRTETPKDGLSRAELKARGRYERVVQERAQLDDLLARIRKVLAQPVRRWPLGKPKRSFPTVFPPPGGTAGPVLPPPGVPERWTTLPTVVPPIPTGPVGPRLPNELTHLSGLDATRPVGPDAK